MPAEDQLPPNPRKITILDGAIFNPWVNVFASLGMTVGLGWLTVWFWGLWMNFLAAPAYEDQNLDIVGGFVGVVACGLATIALFIVTIWVIVWWVKASREHTEFDRESNQLPFPRRPR